MHARGVSGIIRPLFCGNLLDKAFARMRNGISPYRLLVVIVGMAMAGVLLAGCASPGSPGSLSWPWSSPKPTPPAPTTQASAKTAPTKPDPKAMQEVMAELQQLGTLGPGGPTAGDGRPEAVRPESLAVDVATSPRHGGLSPSA